MTSGLGTGSTAAHPATTAGPLTADGTVSAILPTAWHAMGGCTRLAAAAAGRRCAGIDAIVDAAERSAANGRKEIPGPLSLRQPAILRALLSALARWRTAPGRRSADAFALHGLCAEARGLLA